MTLDDILKLMKTAEVHLHVTADECATIYASLTFCAHSFDKLNCKEAKERADECKKLADKILDQM